MLYVPYGVQHCASIHGADALLSILVQGQSIIYVLFIRCDRHTIKYRVDESRETTLGAQRDSKIEDCQHSNFQQKITTAHDRKEELENFVLLQQATDQHHSASIKVTTKAQSHSTSPTMKAAQEVSLDGRYPSETSSLWPTAGHGPGSVEADVIGMERHSDRCTTILTYTMLALVVATGANLVYDDYIRNPDRVEGRLVKSYEQVANQSMTLLNDLSNHDKDTINPVVGCESTVLIVRHCEDLGGHVRYEDGSSHCSYLGFQRSLYLATLFGNETSHQRKATTARWPLPTKLYGLWNQDGTNKRQYELLKPLSDKTGVPIQMLDFETAAEDLRDALFQLLRTGQFCDQVAVVAWKHKFIRPLAATLGCDQEKGCPGGTKNHVNSYAWDDYDFDTVWELQYVYQPEALRAYPQGESIRHHHRTRLVDGWKVFGSVTRENFDALAFKRTYYQGGNQEDSSWLEHDDHV